MIHRLITNPDKLFPLPGTLSIYTARNICDLIQARFPDQDIWMARLTWPTFFVWRFISKELYDAIAHILTVKSMRDFFKKHPSKLK